MLTSPSTLSAGSARTACSDIQRPDYPRSALTPAVVHIGLGGFHRSHQAAYFDELAGATEARWGIVAASLRSRGLVDALGRQDGLYTMLQRDNHGESARIVGSLVDCLFAPDDPARLLAALADPRTRLVTLTITGDGYAATSGAGAAPSPWTVWDYLVEALARRRQSRIEPFTVLSCDNIPDNGRATRMALLSAARSRDEVLARWIGREVACPESMVDRITPGPDEDQRDHVLSAYGVRDRCSIVTEAFSQWIISDEFCNEKPPLEAVGAQFVADVKPYTAMKRRLLNAGHSAIGYLGILAGHRWTDEAMRDPAIRSYIEALMSQEIAPLLPHVPGIDLPAYQRKLLDRFSNAAMRDPLDRLSRRGSTKMPAYLLPSVSEAGQRGAPRELLAIAVAGWMRYLRGSDLSGAPLVIVDPRKEELQQLVAGSGSDPRPLLAKRDLFGDLIDDHRFVAALERSLAALDRGGVAGLLAGTSQMAIAGAA